jgi:dTDP-4-dehydrorhamnose reductase
MVIGGLQIMKKVIILGSTGMLGNEVLMHFLKVNDCDVSSSVRNEKFKIDCNFLFDPTINSVDGLPFADFYINAIGIIKPHMLKNLKSAIYINSIFPRELADECEKRGSKLIHITTDCVFSGKDGNYDEDSLHDALDGYGKSKSLGEPENCMVLRTSIIGPEIHRHVSLISWVQDQREEEINGFTNHLWNGITTLQYAKICEKIINIKWAPLLHL